MAAINDYASHAGAVAANPLGAAVCDDVRSHLDRLGQIATHAESVIHDQRDTRVMTDLRNSRHIRDVELRVPDRLDIDRTRVLIDRIPDLLCILARHKLAMDVELLKIDAELVERATVEIHRADEVMARLTAGGDGHELCGMAGSGGDSTDASLEHCHAVLEDGVSWVAHAGIHIAVLGPGELAGPVIRVVEVVRARLIEGNCAGAIDWIWFLRSMDCDRLILRLPSVQVSNAYLYTQV